VNIYINGKSIDYEIENEATLGEIIDGLQEWMSGKGCVIVSLRLDDKSVNFLEDKSIRSAPIDSCRKMDVEIQNVRVLVGETIHELGNYLDRVARLAPKMQDNGIQADDIKQLVDGLRWSEDVLKRVEGILRISYHDLEFDGEKFSKLLLKLGDIREHIEEAQKNNNHAALAGILGSSLTLLCDRLVHALPLVLENASLTSEGSNLMEEITEQLPIIRELPEKLENIAINISIGDSIKGMEEFAACISSIEEAFILVDRCKKELPNYSHDLDIKGKSFEERNQEIAGILQELIEAFERKDRVLIGDLIEYEIAPVTEGLADILEKIKNSLKESCH